MDGESLSLLINQLADDIAKVKHSKHRPKKPPGLITEQGGLTGFQGANKAMDEVIIASEKLVEAEAVAHDDHGVRITIQPGAIVFGIDKRATAAQVADLLNHILPKLSITPTTPYTPQASNHYQQAIDIHAHMQKQWTQRLKRRLKSIKWKKPANRTR